MITKEIWDELVPGDELLSQESGYYDITVVGRDGDRIEFQWGNGYIDDYDFGEFAKHGVCRIYVLVSPESLLDWVENKLLEDLW